MFGSGRQWPSAAEAEVTASNLVVSNVPLIHNAHHCLNIITIFRIETRGKEHEIFQWCVHTNGSLSVFGFIFVFIKSLLLCVRVSLVCVLIQSSNCSVPTGRQAVREGRDLCSESISLTPATSGFFLPGG